jgi:hypothetical protein
MMSLKRGSAFAAAITPDWFINVPFHVSIRERLLCFGFRWIKPENALARAHAFFDEILENGLVEGSRPDKARSALVDLVQVANEDVPQAVLQKHRRKRGCRDAFQFLARVFAEKSCVSSLSTWPF